MLPFSFGRFERCRRRSSAPPCHALFVAALAFNYHGFIPSTDTSQQKDKSEQTDQSSNKKSEQKDQPGHERKKPVFASRIARTTGNFVDRTRGPGVSSRMTERNPQALEPASPLAG